MPQTRHMSNHTAAQDRDLDQFHADMVNAAMHDTVELMHAEDSDYTPVPREFWGMSYGEVMAVCDEWSIEQYLAEQARDQIPHRWQ